MSWTTVRAQSRDAQARRDAETRAMADEIARLKAEIARRKAALAPRLSPRLDTPIGQVHVPVETRGRIPSGRTAYGHVVTVNGRRRPVRDVIRSHTDHTHRHAEAPSTNVTFRYA